MMNPIAISMLALGALLIVLGLILLAKHRKTLGLILSFAGFITAVAPLVITYILFG